ncbi:Calmodulin [Armadillidium nasatum]|uniref:Calmodulin n=1 Tax=Armadillidium nasatum TaxID=96803 RepID=A0A5N5TAF5_9CRUS|nr:Calmodulin [Armadillidium nasatum]
MLQKFREAFRFFDKDGDGSIDKQELGRVMRSLGQFATEEELREMLDEIDIDGDGTFSFNEFVDIVCNVGRPTERSVEDEEKELRDAFRDIYVKTFRLEKKAREIHFYFYSINLKSHNVIKLNKIKLN